MLHSETTTFVGWMWRFSPIILCAAGGYLFNQFVGCKSGVCPITRSRWLIMINGPLIGAMMMPW